MRTGRYNLKELLTHNEIDQIIIPELQRDYVWKEENVQKLLNSILSHFTEKKELHFEVHIENKILEEGAYSYLKKEYERLRFNLKLGFIYAYHDNEYPGKFFLIDGQQRFTTLYLLLLAVYVNLNQKEKFRKLYFPNNVLKIDYKVRESSHDFMMEFVENELQKNPVKIISSKNYFSLEYDKDETIQNLITNYELIKQMVQNSGLSVNKQILSGFLEFVEDYVEFNYFDTNLSEQGEQLYLYMNSRGEHLSHQELLKSEIIKKIGSNGTPEKKKLGQKWEDWQNFFWQHSGDNENADNGFQEFIKWISIIEISLLSKEEIKSKKVYSEENDSLLEIKERYIKKGPIKIKDSSSQENLLYRYQVQNITPSALSEFFNALEYLYNIESEFLPIEERWLANEISTLDYVVLLPLLYFVKNSNFSNEVIKTKALIRFAMFLKNLTYFESIAKVPDNSTIVALNLVQEICKKNDSDITSLLDEEFENKYKSILTKAERFKLEELKKSPNRTNIENLIWTFTLDQKIVRFFEGDLSPIFSAASYHQDFEVSAGLGSIKNLSIIQSFIELFNDWFYPNRHKDKLRRALLTIEDYSITNKKIKGSWLFKNKRIEGYSFGKDHKQFENEWLEIFQKNPAMLFKFLRRIEPENSDKAEDVFSQMINEFDTDDWRLPIIKKHQVLSYCNNKRILRNGNKIILIQDKQSGYIQLPNFLLKEIYYPKMWLAEYNLNALEFIVEKNKWKERNRAEDIEQFAIGIKEEDSVWYYFVLFRNDQKAKAKLQPFAQRGWISENVNKVRQVDNMLFKDDESKTLEENLNALYDKIETLKKELVQIIEEPEFASSNISS